MTRVLQPPAAIFLVVIVSCSAADAPPVESAGGRDPTLTEEYVRSVQKGERELAMGDLAAARQSFLRALNEDLIEAPNFEVLVKLAEIACRMDQRENGRQLLSDFRCMLTVDAGKSKCFSSSGEATAEPRPNASLAPDCFERMCSEMYLGYYDSPSPKRLRRLEELDAEAQRVDQLCK